MKKRCYIEGEFFGTAEEPSAKYSMKSVAIFEKWSARLRRDLWDEGSAKQRGVCEDMGFVAGIVEVLFSEIREAFVADGASSVLQ